VFLGGTAFVTLVYREPLVPRACPPAFLPTFAISRLGLSIAVLVTLGAITPISAAGIPHLFGSKEVRSSDLHHFPKWTDMLERYRHEASSAHWDRFIDGLRDIDPLAQLDRVNRYMNDMPYKADAGNYAATD